MKKINHFLGLLIGVGLIILGNLIPESLTVLTDVLRSSISIAGTLIFVITLYQLLRVHKINEKNDSSEKKQ